ncbi:unnamed protein product [Phaedon cochleariae]|uniref:Tesmin/TSO1-like CXC domain-containing protein n=1 Tax=Phaedon cochleariae TaxID=80249 RepID=A0A9N9SFK9_PHACE|nr:unnamed protein product [Phaedon cochleariae]
MFIMSLYPGKTSDDLKERRFQILYLQVQEWLGNPLPPTDWGFEKHEEGHLRPVTNRSKPAPDRLLEMVSCYCTQGCESKKCSCRRHKMVCSNICRYCAGHGCSNKLREEDEDNVDHADKDLEPIPCTETDVEFSLA